MRNGLNVTDRPLPSEQADRTPPYRRASFAFYDAQDVRRLLDMDGCIAAIRTAMKDFTASQTDQPLRMILPVAAGDVFALMPGMLEAPHGFGAKVITAFADRMSPGRSAHRGVVILFDQDSGEIVCQADAGEITHLRTAAASAVATEALARADAGVLTIFGYGAQAWTHALAMARVRPLDEIRVWGRSADTGHAFAAQVEATIGIACRFVPDGREAAAGADIICTVTGSRQPILHGDWVAPGTHVNLVGSSYAGPVEVDTALVASARFIADSRRSVLAAGAEFLVAKATGAIGDQHIVAEIGEVLLGRIAGRTREEERTIYKSLGHVVQDLAATAYVHERAQAKATQA